ncbi:MAG: (2Fe-2S)-binding protein [Turneriella sp.]|nr:(2Fe-2S)-binding protein [Leptospiraceae bacterium]MCX7632178.1 (2Fe-2S)-binding protein [Turneriella sp.]
MDVAALMRPRKLCLCKGVSREDIARVVRGGVRSFAELVQKTQATTGCGTCIDEVYAAFCQERASCEVTDQQQLPL